MKSPNKKTIIIASVIIVVAAVAAAVIILPAWPMKLAAPVQMAQQPAGNANQLAGAGTSTVPAQMAPIPQGSQTYQIMQVGSAMPKIVQATIDPVNVHVGDTQTMTVIVSDPDPVTSVVATIRTDNETTTVPLTLDGPAALNDVVPQKYFVNSQNQLAFVDPNKEGGNSNVAFAAQGDEKYSAQWKVQDTHVAFYSTIFTATDAKGNVSSARINWTDALCTWAGHNNWSGATWDASSSANGTASPYGSSGCTLGNGTARTVDGVENGKMLIDAPMTISSNSILVFNPSGSISFSGSGVLTIVVGGQIIPSEMYCASSTWVLSFSNPADGTSQVARSALSNNVFPGQTAFFTATTTTNYGAGTWNYNCNSVTSSQSTAIATYTCGSSVSCVTPGNGCGGLSCNNTQSGSAGWVTSVPACGVNGTYENGTCSTYNTGSISGSCGVGCSGPTCNGSPNASVQAQACN